MVIVLLMPKLSVVLLIFGLSVVLLVTVVMQVDSRSRLSIFKFFVCMISLQK